MSVSARYLTIVVMVFMAVLGYGQTFSVVSLESVPTDISATRYPRTDLNGNKCGLLKVRCVLDGIEFSGNVIGDVEYKNAEYWLYLTGGTKKLSIMHPKVLPLDLDLTAYLGSGIQSAQTCRLVLSIPDALYSAVVAQTVTPNASQPAASGEAIVQSAAAPAESSRPGPSVSTESVSSPTSSVDSYRPESSVYAETNVQPASNPLPPADTSLTPSQMVEKGRTAYNSKNYTEAFTWYSRAAEQGNVDGQYHLGSMYYNGRGVLMDLAQAKEWLLKAAAQGNSAAKRDLEDNYGIKE